VLLLVRALRAAEDDVVADISVAKRPPKSRLDGVVYVNGSVLDPSFFAALPAAPLAVYLSGPTSAYLSDPVTTVRLATEGLDRALTHTERSEGFVFVSSARIYGPRLDQTALHESDLASIRSPDPRNVYDGSKLVGEALCLLAATRRHVVIVRPGNVYGPDTGCGTATAISDMARQAVRDGRIVVKGSPLSTRNHVHAEDVAEGIVRALLLGRAGDAFNLGSEEHVSSVEMAKRVARALPVEVPIETENPDIRADHMTLSIEKAIEQLGYRPRRGLDDSLPAAVRSLTDAASSR
jgi:UDP-glucuronate decarboxylase